MRRHCEGSGQRKLFDRSTLLFGSRALAVTAADEDLPVYAQQVTEAANSLDDDVVWEVVDLLFPKFIAVTDLLTILDALEKHQGADSDYGWRGQRIIQRLSSPADLETLLQGLMTAVGPGRRVEPDGAETSREKRLKPLIQAAASTLMKLTPVNQSNELVVDAAIRLADGRHSPRRFEDKEFYPLLVVSPERRRRGLWRAVEKLQDHPWIKRLGLTNISQLDVVGWSTGLKPEDASWLIEDAREAKTHLERRLAFDALMRVWSDAGSPALCSSAFGRLLPSTKKALSSFAAGSRLGSSQTRKSSLTAK